MGADIYTIGYAGFPEPDEFISCLKRYGIDSLCDVRSIPRSSYFEQYNDYNLNKQLKKNGIAYLPFGKEFGARQENPIYYTGGPDSYLDFEKYVKSPEFLEGFDRIEHGLEIGRTPAFMCAEKDPTSCHRAIMVSRVFSESGYNMLHIIVHGKMNLPLWGLQKTRSSCRETFSCRTKGNQFKQKNARLRLHPGGASPQWSK